MPRVTQVKMGRLAITMESGDTWSRIVLRHLSCPWLHVQSAKDHAGEEAALSGVSPRGQTLKTIRTKNAWGSAQKLCPNHTWGTPGIDNSGGQSVDLLLDTRETYSMLTEAPGQLSPGSTSTMELPGWNKHCYFSCPLSCNWDSTVFTWVSDFARVSLTPFGRDILNKVHVCFHEYGTLSLSPLNEQNVNPRMWTDGKTVGQAQNAIPVLIRLKDPIYFRIKISIHWNPRLRKG